jgi:hypothetical protein
MFVQTTVMNVDATSYNVYYGNTGSLFRVINLGEATIWIGAMPANSTGTVNIAAAYPIRPGETLDNIPGAIGTDREWAGFNTISGTSQLRILDSNN